MAQWGADGFAQHGWDYPRILAHYYQEAAAIDFYGPSLRLPHAISPHLSYWYWAPPRMHPTTAVLINYAPQEANLLFTDCREAGTVTNSLGVHNNDYGAPILVCSNPRQPGQGAHR